MMQQYVVLRKENDLLNSLIGQSFNQKSKFEAEKILNEIHSKTQSRLISKKALCYIVDKNEILGVGGSTIMKDKNGKIVSNLILDNCGIWLAGLLKGGVLAKSVVLKDLSNVNKTFNIYQFGSLFNAQVNFRMLMKVGSGTTVPARTDFDIETSFPTAPESGNMESSIPLFNSALGNFKNAGSLTAGGSGTINESVLLSVWDTSSNINTTITLFRDIISPGQAFVAGQSIALEYTTQL